MHLHKHIHIWFILVALKCGWLTTIVKTQATKTVPCLPYSWWKKYTITKYKGFKSSNQHLELYPERSWVPMQLMQQWGNVGKLKGAQHSVDSYILNGCYVKPGNYYNLLISPSFSITLLMSFSFVQSFRHSLSHLFINTVYLFGLLFISYSVVSLLASQEPKAPEYSECIFSSVLWLYQRTKG